MIYDSREKVVVCCVCCVFLSRSLLVVRGSSDKDMQCRDISHDTVNFNMMVDHVAKTVHEC